MHIFVPPPKQMLSYAPLIIFLEVAFDPKSPSYYSNRIKMSKCISVHVEQTGCQKGNACLELLPRASSSA